MADKECPYCLETIKARALKCRHCGSDLREPLTEPELAIAAPRKNLVVYLLTLLLAVGVGVLWFTAIRKRKTSDTKIASGAQLSAKKSAAPASAAPSPSPAPVAASTAPSHTKGRTTPRATRPSTRRPHNREPGRKTPTARLARWKKYGSQSPPFAVSLPQNTTPFSVTLGPMHLRGRRHKGSIRSYWVAHHKLTKGSSASDAMERAFTGLRRRDGAEVLSRNWTRFAGGRVALEGTLVDPQRRVHEVRICVVDGVLFVLATETDSQAPSFGTLVQDAHRFFASFRGGP